MSSEIDPALIRQLVNETIIGNYVFYATLTVLIFDLIDSFEMEIKHFWSARKSAVNVLYFVNRHGAILATILQLLRRLTYFFGVLDPVIMLCVDYILMLRVQALYSRGRVISIILFAAFGIDAIALIGFAIQGLVIDDPEVVGVAPGLTICLVNAPPLVEYTISWGIPLAYGTLLLVLAFYKAAVIWKESAGLKGVSLVKVLIRDQALYFLALILVCFADIVAGVVNTSSVLLSNVLNVAGNPAFLSILGARLLFNMKEAGEKGLNQGTSCPTTSTVSEIDFAAPPAGAVESSLEETPEGGEAEIEEIPV